MKLSILGISLLLVLGITTGLVTGIHAIKTATCSNTSPPLAVSSTVNCGHCGTGTMTVTVSSQLQNGGSVTGKIVCGNSEASCTTTTTCTASTISTDKDTLLCYTNPGNSGSTSTCQFSR